MKMSLETSERETDYVKTGKKKERKKNENLSDITVNKQISDRSHLVLEELLCSKQNVQDTTS